MQANRRKSACEGKQRFGSYRLASRIASKLAHKRSQKMQPYPCNDCGGFHVGNATGNKDRRKVQ